MKALALLGGLPSRQSSSAETDAATFFIALEGVTKFGLVEATKRVLKGALDHGFFPSPPELRMQCDKVMKPYEDMRDRVRERQRNRFPPLQDRPPLTEEEKQRQRERMARFHASDKNVVAELAAIRAKYDPAELAKVPDAPLPENWKRPA